MKKTPLNVFLLIKERKQQTFAEKLNSYKFSFAATKFVVRVLCIIIFGFFSSCSSTKDKENYETAIIELQDVNTSIQNNLKNRSYLSQKVGLLKA